MLIYHIFMVIAPKNTHLWYILEYILELHNISWKN
jgi:hypothetical protein